MKFIIIALLLIPFAAGTSSAKQESSKLSSDAMRHLRAADFFPLSMNGASVEGSGASNTSVQTMLSAKSSKMGISHSGVCTKRLNDAFNSIQQLPDFFPGVFVLEDVTKLCSFVPMSNLVARRAIVGVSGSVR
jgi:hypothetical protein